MIIALLQEWLLDLTNIKAPVINNLIVLSTTYASWEFIIFYGISNFLFLKIRILKIIYPKTIKILQMLTYLNFCFNRINVQSIIRKIVFKCIFYIWLRAQYLTSFISEFSFNFHKVFTSESNWIIQLYGSLFLLQIRYNFYSDSNINC